MPLIGLLFGVGGNVAEHSSILFPHFSMDSHDLFIVHHDYPSDIAISGPAMWKTEPACIFGSLLRSKNWVGDHNAQGLFFLDRKTFLKTFVSGTIATLANEGVAQTLKTILTGNRNLVMA